jgi:hypothetical protein
LTHSLTLCLSLCRIPVVSGSATSATLSNTELYPYFSRLVPPDNYQGQAIAGIIKYFGWNKTACISTTDEYGVNGIKSFIAAASQVNISVATYQQFLPGESDVSVQVRELANSKARVFVAFMLTADFQTVLNAAQNRTLIGDHYVWFCADGCINAAVSRDPVTNQVSYQYRQDVRGLIGMYAFEARQPYARSNPISLALACRYNC